MSRKYSLWIKARVFVDQSKAPFSGCMGMTYNVNSTVSKYFAKNGHSARWNNQEAVGYREEWSVFIHVTTGHIGLLKQKKVFA